MKPASLKVEGGKTSSRQNPKDKREERCVSLKISAGKETAADKLKKNAPCRLSLSAPGVQRSSELSPCSLLLVP